MLMYFRIFLQELLCKLALRLYICSKYITIIIIVYRLHPGLPFSLFMKCLNNNVIYFSPTGGCLSKLIGTFLFFNFNFVFFLLSTEIPKVKPLSKLQGGCGSGHDT